MPPSQIVQVKEQNTTSKGKETESSKTLVSRASINWSNRVVPTLLFSDGAALTNPSVIAVKEKLAAL
jgi:mycoredoxin